LHWRINLWYKMVHAHAHLKLTRASVPDWHPCRLCGPTCNLFSAALPVYGWRYFREIRLSLLVQRPKQSKVVSFFALFKEAVLGSRQDFTAISIDRAIILLAVPMVLVTEIFLALIAIYVFRLGRWKRTVV
jgi:hypothetical protein